MPTGEEYKKGKANPNLPTAAADKNVWDGCTCSSHIITYDNKLVCFNLAGI